MTDSPNCPQCGSKNTYPMGSIFVCPDCFYEWNPDFENEDFQNQDGLKIFDANGTELHNGDAVIIIKDLPVKGFSKPIKAGTKVKNIRLVEGDHNIDCKIEGFGAMSLKSIYVKKG